MEQLYKGRYLIVLYRRNGEIKDVLTSVSDNRASYISKVFNGHLKDDNVEFIDVFEKHNDCFAEEDKIFLDYLIEQGVLHYRNYPERVKNRIKIQELMK